MPIIANCVLCAFTCFGRLIPLPASKWADTRFFSIRTTLAYEDSKWLEASTGHDEAPGVAARRGFLNIRTGAKHVGGLATPGRLLRNRTFLIYILVRLGPSWPLGALLEQLCHGVHRVVPEPASGVVIAPCRAGISVPEGVLQMV